MAAVVLALGMQGCGAGASSNRDAISASVRAYVTALAKHDAAGACAAITPAYWFAAATEINGRLPGQVAALPRNDCQQGLKRVFSGTTATSAAVSKFILSDVRIQGRIATAHLTLGASTSNGQGKNARFVRTLGGVWRIDCCTGPQVARLPTTTYRVPSGGMEPTLKVGQSVTSDNASVGSHPPALGDIVVFHPPAGADSASPMCGSPVQGSGHPQPCGAPTQSESGQTFIKRVVGLPGDRIAIVNGHVIRNGVREGDPYINPCPASQSGACNFPKPVVVPAADYFMLGDNRGASDDSRFWGPIKRGWIVGVVKR